MTTELKPIDKVLKTQVRIDADPDEPAVSVDAVATDDQSAFIDPSDLRASAIDDLFRRRMQIVFVSFPRGTASRTMRQVARAAARWCLADRTGSGGSRSLPAGWALDHAEQIRPLRNSPAWLSRPFGVRGMFVFVSNAGAMIEVWADREASARRLVHEVDRAIGSDLRGLASVA